LVKQQFGANDYVKSVVNKLLNNREYD